MPIPAIRESAQAPFRAAPPRKPKAAPRSHPTHPSPHPAHPSPNYATREETMKAVARVVNEDAEVFRRLANA